MSSEYFHKSDWLSYELPADYNDHLDDNERDLLRNKRKKEKDEDSLSDYSDLEDLLDSVYDSEELDPKQKMVVLRKLVWQDYVIVERRNNMTKEEEKKFFDQLISDQTNLEIQVRYLQKKEDFGESLEDFNFETKDPSSVKALTFQSGKPEKFNQLLPKLEKFENLQTFEVKVEFGSIPLEVCQLKSITWLSFALSGLTEIPPEICQLQQLYCLSLNNNKISTFPAELFKLTNLAMLDLSFNEISSVPDEMSLLTKMMDLDISYNKIIWIPAILKKLLFLNWFDFSNNKLIPGYPQEWTDLDNREKVEKFWKIHQLYLDVFVYCLREQANDFVYDILHELFEKNSKIKYSKEGHPIGINDITPIESKDVKQSNNNQPSVVVPKKKLSQNVVKKRKAKKNKSSKKKSRR